ncbi:MAG: serine/threonine-protein kinase [Planctomycetota bacterium]
MERIGAGAFGEVWRIRQPDLGREEAIKFATSADGEQLLRREAEAMRVLANAVPHHPNIVHVTGINLDVQPAWIAMECAEYGSLSRLIARGPVPPAHVRTLFAGVCAALAVAHSTGIVHGDVKPANILLTADGTARLSDFGLGTSSAAQDQTASAVVNSALNSRLAGPGGTPLFLSPERLASNDPVASDDVFAVGVSMLHALTGDATAHPQYAARLATDLASAELDVQAAAQLMLECLAPSRLRPTAQQLSAKLSAATASVQSPTTPTNQHPPDDAAVAFAKCEVAHTEAGWMQFILKHATSPLANQAEQRLAALRLERHRREKPATPTAWERDQLAAENARREARERGATAPKVGGHPRTPPDSLRAPESVERERATSDNAESEAKRAITERADRSLGWRNVGASLAMVAFAVALMGILQLVPRGSDRPGSLDSEARRQQAQQWRERSARGFSLAFQLRELAVISQDGETVTFGTAGPERGDGTRGQGTPRFSVRLGQTIECAGYRLRLVSVQWPITMEVVGGLDAGSQLQWKYWTQPNYKER